jgi:hypothetical protein
MQRDIGHINTLSERGFSMFSMSRCIAHTRQRKTYILISTDK